MVYGCEQCAKKRVALCSTCYYFGAHDGQGSVHIFVFRLFLSENWHHAKLIEG
jgi:hypothetical protein